MTGQKAKLLVCMIDFPFPARKNGITIRYFPILKHALNKFDIHLITIANNEVSQLVIDEANKICTKVSVHVRKPKNVHPLIKFSKRLKAFIPGTTPFHYVCYDEREIVDFIAKETRGTHYDLALSVMLETFFLVKNNVKADRHVFDVIDSPYSTKLRVLEKNIFSKYDCWMIKQWERCALKQADSACYISPLDRKIGAGPLASQSNIGIIPNGLFLDDHENESISFGCPTIGFIGHMQYLPNIRAAQRLYRIFKTKQSDLGNVKLVIIGRDPAPEILKLAEDPQVIVTGTVENIWPYINGIDIFVFPMEIGSGQQNKLLEAMGASKPVIASSLANSGIGATNNKELLEVETDHEFGNAIVNLLKNPTFAAQLARNAKFFIDTHFTWQAIYKDLDDTLFKVN